MRKAAAAGVGGDAARRRSGPRRGKRDFALELLAPSPRSRADRPRRSARRRRRGGLGAPLVLPRSSVDGRERRPAAGRSREAAAAERQEPRYEHAIVCSSPRRRGDDGERGGGGETKPPTAPRSTLQQEPRRRARRRRRRRRDHEGKVIELREEAVSREAAARTLPAARGSLRDGVRRRRAARGGGFRLARVGDARRRGGDLRGGELSARARRLVAKRDGELIERRAVSERCRTAAEEAARTTPFGSSRASRVARDPRSADEAAEMSRRRGRGKEAARANQR